MTLHLRATVSSGTPVYRQVADQLLAALAAGLLVAQSLAGAQVRYFDRPPSPEQLRGEPITRVVKRRFPVRRRRIACPCDTPRSSGS